MSKLIDTHLDGANELVWTRDDVEVARLSSGNVFTFPPGALGGSLSFINAFNVKAVAYGAKGDNVTDDRAAIQSAINDAAAATYGGIVYFPPGKYLIGTPGLVMPTSAQVGITLMGAGMGGVATGMRTTELIRNGAYAILSASGTGTDDSTINHGLRVTAMTLNGNAQANDLVTLTRCSEAIFDQVRFYGSHRRAFYGVQLWNSRFSNCAFELSGDSGTTTPAVEFTDSGDANGNTNTILITNCSFEANLYTDLKLNSSQSSYPCAGVVLSSCKFERSAKYAINFANASKCGVVSSYFFTNASVGGDSPCLSHNGGSQNYAVGCSFESANPSTTSFLVDLITGSKFVLAGCTLKGASSSHVRLQTNFGDAALTGLVHSTMGSEKWVTDNRTTKSGGDNPRDGISRAAQGFLVETFDRKLSASSVLPLSGDLRGALVGLRAGDVISTVSITITVAGSSVTHAQVGVYKTDGTLVASSADSAADRTACQSTGVVTFTLATPYQVPSDDGYYLTVTLSASTTVPTLLRGSSQAGSINAVGSGVVPTVIQTGQATVPSPATFATSASTVWLAAA